MSTGDSKPSADSIRTRSACFFVIKGRLKMAVRAEDIVRNSEVSARVRAGPPARAVPRVTDALKSATFEPQCHDRPFRVETSHSYPGSQKHRLKGNMNSSRCLTDEVCVRLMSSIVDSSCPRRDSTPIGTIRSHAARRPQRKLSSVISGGGIPSPVPATALPIAIAVDDRWHPIHDWRWIGLIDIGTRRPIGTRWCIVGLVDYRRWWRRNRRVIATHIGLSQS